MRVSEIDVRLSCLLASVASLVRRVTPLQNFRLIGHLISRRVSQDGVLRCPSPVNSKLTNISQVYVLRRFQHHVGRFHGSALGLGEFQWTEGREEIPIVSDRLGALTEPCQWWDAMQETSSRVNRPIGWAFGGITNGEIRYMKLWQVSVGENCLCRDCSQFSATSQ